MYTCTVHCMYQISHMGSIFVNHSNIITVENNKLLIVKQTLLIINITVLKMFQGLKFKTFPKDIQHF